MTNIETFIQIADLSLIEAVQAVCRSRFPHTVAAFDDFTTSDMETIKRGGLRSLPDERLKPLIASMKKDAFIFSAS